MKLTRILAAGLIAAGITAAIPAGLASAHHPEPSSSSACNTDGTWSATVTAGADAVRGYTWNLTAPVVTAAVADSQLLTFTVGPFASSSAGPGTITVAARWLNGAGQQVATGSRPVTIVAPSTACTAPTTTAPATTTTTTVVEETTTTTTAPATTTTTTVVEEATTTTAPSSSSSTTPPAPSTTEPTVSVGTAPVPSSIAPATTIPLDPVLPATGSTTTGLILGAILVAAGIVALLVRRPAR